MQSTPEIFTPSPKFGGGNTGMTFTTCAGAYVLNQNMVQGSIKLVWSAQGSSTGDLTIEGLPYTSSAVAGALGGASIIYCTGVNPTADEATIVGFIDASTSLMRVYFTPTDAGTLVTNVTHADLTNTSSLFFTFSYFIDR